MDTGCAAVLDGLTRERIVWTPQPGPQTEACQCPFFEILYGGAKGGGKTDWLIGDYASGVERYGSAWKGIILRRTFPEFEQIERRAIEIFSPIYGIDSYKRGRKTWELKTARGTATLRLGVCKDPGDETKYQGIEYTYVGCDELTHWADDKPLNFLITCMRSPTGVPCMVRNTANPGGLGHEWVKKRYRIPPGEGSLAPRTPFLAGKRGVIPVHRVFIPALVTDNLILMKNDPGYAENLDNISNPALRRAYRYGDWSIISGAAFPEFDPEIHVIDTFNPPPGVPITRSLDWGRVKPYGCLWSYQDYDGNAVFCGELYGWNGTPNEGVGEDPEIVRDRIIEYEQARGWTVTEAYLDPQCWAEDTEGIYERLGGSAMLWQPWPKGPGSRIAQVTALHDLLKVVNGRSRCKIMRNCPNLARTLASIQVAKNDPEDIDTHGEDHLIDAMRGVLSKKFYSREDLRALRSQRNQNSQAPQYGRHGGW